MGQEFVAANPAARELYDRAAKILGYDLAKLCFEGPAEKLDSTVVSQPAIFVTSLAALEVLRQKSPDVVQNAAFSAGLSLGEYTALVFAGVMDFESGLRVVQRRGEAMQAASDAVSSGMVSILGMELAAIEQLCDQARQSGEVLRVANHLCPGNIAVSGHRASCEKVAELATAAGAMKVVPLAVAGAFHTSIMQPAVSRLAEALAGVKLNPPRIPVVSNVDAKTHSDPEEIRRLLTEQVVSPVKWEDSIRFLQAQGCDAFYEVGPGRVLRGLMKRIDRKANCQGVLD